jgi:HK97 family phage major capsid protein
VAVDDADAATAGFLVTPQVEAALSKLKDGNSAYHLAPYAGAAGSQQVAGRRMVVSSNVPANGTKGSGIDLSTVIYGNFNDLMIAQWGALEVLVDPYSDFATGTVGVRALQSIDIGVRHAESFAAMTDAVA